MATVKYFDNKYLGWSVWINPYKSTRTINGTLWYTIELSISLRYYPEDDGKDYDEVKTALSNKDWTVRIGGGMDKYGGWRVDGYQYVYNGSARTFDITVPITFNDTGKYVTAADYVVPYDIYDLQSERDSFWNNYCQYSTESFLVSLPISKTVSDTICNLIDLSTQEIQPDPEPEPTPEPENPYAPTEDNEWGWHTNDWYKGDNSYQGRKLLNANGDTVFEFSWERSGNTRNFKYTALYYPYNAGYAGFSEKQVYDHLYAEENTVSVKPFAKYREIVQSETGWKFVEGDYSGMTFQTTSPQSNNAITQNTYYTYESAWITAPDYAEPHTNINVIFKLRDIASGTKAGLFNLNSFNEIRVEYTGNNGASWTPSIGYGNLGVGIFAPQYETSPSQYTGPFKLLVSNPTHTTTITNNMSVAFDYIDQTLEAYDTNTAVVTIPYATDNFTHLIDVGTYGGETGDHVRVRLSYHIDEQDTPPEPPIPSGVTGEWYFSPDQLIFTQGSTFSFRYDPDLESEGNIPISYSYIYEGETHYIGLASCNDWIPTSFEDNGIYTLVARWYFGNVEYSDTKNIEITGNPFPDWSGDTYGICFNYLPDEIGEKTLHVHQDGDDDFTPFDGNVGTIQVWEKIMPYLRFTVAGSKIVGQKSKIYVYTDSDSLITVKINGNIIGAVYNGQGIEYTWTAADELECILTLSVVETDDYLANEASFNLDVRYYCGIDADPDHFTTSADAQHLESQLSYTRMQVDTIDVDTTAYNSWLHPYISENVLHIIVDESVDGERQGYVTVYGRDNYGSLQSKNVYVTQKWESLKINPEEADITFSGGTVNTGVQFTNLSGLTCVSESSQVTATLSNISQSTATLSVTVPRNYTNLPQSHSVKVSGTGIYSNKLYERWFVVHQNVDPSIGTDVKDGLFINGQKADITSNVKIALTYKATDTENPQAVKNTYSKTVELVGTDSNNKIFGDFWMLDRGVINKSGIIQEAPSGYPWSSITYNVTGINFNPKKRVEFEFWDKGEIVENGYVSLDSVTENDGIVKYSVTLYGGLGDFFYNLMYDEETGEEKNLSNMYYGFARENFGPLTHDEENERTLIVWNKNYILDTWGYLYSGVDHSGNTVPVGDDTDMHIANWVTAVPTNSGIYGDFDNDKVLVNVSSFSTTHSGRGYGTTRAGGESSGSYTSAYSSLFPSSFKTDSATTYTQKYGYGRMTLQRDMTEWETRDLRSQYQRPAVRLKLILDAISNPENNGGYTINWPAEMLQSGTPLNLYYDKSWILFDRLDFADSEENETRDISLYNYTTLNIFSYRNKDTKGETYVGDRFWTYETDPVDGRIYTNESFQFLESGYTNPGVEVSISPLMTANGADLSSFPASGYTCFIEGDYDYWGEYNGRGGTQTAHYTGTSVFCGAYCYRLVSYYLSGTTAVEAGHTPWYAQYSYDPEMRVTSKVEFSNGWRSSTSNFRFNKSYLDFAGSMINPDDVILVNNPLQKKTSPAVSWYEFQKPIQLKLKTEPHDHTVYIIEFKYVWGFNTSHPVGGTYPSWRGAIGTGTGANCYVPAMQYEFYDGSDDDEYINGYYNYSPSVVQSMNLKKSTLFRDTASPYEYLVGFTRLFNLRYSLDTVNKTVTILKRQDYFADRTLDVSDKIVRDKDLKVKPTTTEYKWYDYTLETPETYATSLYKMKYGEEYGGYSYNTGYYFNSERNNIFEDTKYKNVAVFRCQSPYFQTSIQMSGGTAYPTVALIPYYKWCLWKDNPDNPTELESSEIDKYGAQSYSNVSKIYDWPKVCCFDKENENVSDIDNALVFFERTETVSAPYQITDNIPLMMKLNADKPCYMLCPAESGEVVTGKIDENEEGIIAYRVSTLPVFSKCYTSNGTVYDVSYDFDVPRGSFTGSDIAYEDDTTIYGRYWKDYINDLYDEDAKSVEVYYFLRQNPKQAMRQFYWFDDALWVLNEVKDYDPRSDEPTKCVFVKVRSKADYIN